MFYLILKSHSCVAVCYVLSGALAPASEAARKEAAGKIQMDKEAILRDFLVGSGLRRCGAVGLEP